ncbi:MAG: sigma-70 family RNA polymerase sigma factor [Myxococcales bacterium]|nr:sigma-70 family RNA polymerase sigma factor [Myxococcales bacterium]
MGTDEVLLERWVAGETRAGEELVERHFQAIWRFFRSKVRDDVDDLVQQVFLGCVESRERFRAASSFRTYLFGVARHKLYRYLREQRKNAQIDFGVTSLPGLGTSPTGAVERDDRRRLILEALQRLPVSQQLVIELTYWEGLSGPEVAEVMAAPIDTVYTWLRRGKANLRSHLQAAKLGDMDAAALMRELHTCQSSIA